MAIRILHWIKGWHLLKSFKQDNANLKSAVAHAVVLLDKIRTITESPTIEKIEAIIPGDWDAKLVESVKTVLPKVIALLNDNSPCLEKENFAERLSCVLSNITETTDDTVRATKWHSLVSFMSVEFAKVLDDGKFDINDVFILVADGYKALIKK